MKIIITFTFMLIVHLEIKYIFIIFKYRFYKIWILKNTKWQNQRSLNEACVLLYCSVKHIITAFVFTVWKTCLLILLFYICIELSSVQSLLTCLIFKSSADKPYSLHTDICPAAMWTQNHQKDANMIKSHCKPFYCCLEQVMSLSYIRTPDISSPAVSDDVITMFLNAEQGAECQTAGLSISVFLVWLCVSL